MGKSIDIEGITFQYDEKTVIDSLSLSINQGEFVTIIGPNGSGKSTLLKLLAANISPREGTIYLNGENLKSYGKKALSKDMAVVPQDTGIDYDFRVYEIVLMGRYPHQSRFRRETQQDHRVVRGAMERTNTWHLRDRRVNELSGGEGQRVILARALAQEPQVILLDEPTASLDIHHQLEVLELLKELNEEQGVTIIAVLHDLNLAARYSQQILLLHRGQKITMGKTEAVLTVENLQLAYNMEMMIEKNPYTNRLMIYPLGVKSKDFSQRGPSVHLVCGGGSGRELLPVLMKYCSHITMGVINQGDSDWELGVQLRLEMAAEAPFSQISQESLKQAAILAQAQDVIVMTSVPLGWGNIENLTLVEDQLKQGKRAYLLDQYHQKELYDYTQGQGDSKLAELRKMGLKSCLTMEALIKELINNDR